MCPTRGRPLRETADLTGRVIELTFIALRDAVGKIQHTATSREEVAARMQHGLDAASAGWGLAGTRVEVRSHEVIDAAATPAAALEHYRMALERAGLADGRQGVVFESLGGEEAPRVQRRADAGTGVVSQDRHLRCGDRAPRPRLSLSHGLLYKQASPTAATGELCGDLIIRGSGDPAFLIENTFIAAGALRACGVARVLGNLVVTGSFYCKRSAGQRAATLLKAALNRESWTRKRLRKHSSGTA